MELQGKTILLVGASGSLGSSLAERLQQQGARLIKTHNRQSVDGSQQLDLTSDGSIRDLLAHLGDAKLDGVIIAAGLVAFGPADSTPSEIVDKLMRVNATGPINLVSSLVPNLTGQDSFVLTLSGKVAEIPTSGIAAYSASKSALYAYSVAAGRELRRAGIRWIDARPGHTETGLAGRAIFGTAPAFGQGLTAASVADRIITAILQGEKDLPSAAFD